MSFIPFKTLFPQVADEEALVVGFGDEDASDADLDAYHFLEFFCSDKGCDCRRVMFAVVDIATEEIAAIIAWGWEDREFYKKRFTFADDDDLAHLTGPVLDFSSPTGEKAEFLLDFFKIVVATEKDTVEQIKAHYTLFREALDSGADPAAALCDKPGKKSAVKGKKSKKKHGTTDGLPPGYVMRIDVKGIRPPIWRRIWVPADYTLKKFHDVIQHAMGWQDYHLHSFKIDGRTYGIPDDDFDIFDTLPEAKYRLSDVIHSEKQKIEYEYDFGDGWEHVIVVEKFEERAAEDAIVLKGKRACPPEDCGGVWGYYLLLESLAKKAAGKKLDAEEREIYEWGEQFEPEAFDLESINEELRRRL